MYLRLLKNHRKRLLLQPYLQLNKCEFGLWEETAESILFTAVTKPHFRFMVILVKRSRYVRIKPFLMPGIIFPLKINIFTDLLVEIEWVWLSNDINVMDYLSTSKNNLSQITTKVWTTKKWLNTSSGPHSSWQMWPNTASPSLTMALLVKWKGACVLHKWREIIKAWFTSYFFVIQHLYVLHIHLSVCCKYQAWHC